MMKNRYLQFYIHIGFYLVILAMACTTVISFVKERDGLHSTSQVFGIITLIAALFIIERGFRRFQLMEAELERYSILVQNSGDFIAVGSLERKILFMNSAGKRMIGYSDRQDLRGFPTPNLYSVADDLIMKNEVIPAIQTVGFWNGEIRLKHQVTGELIPVLSQCFVIRDPETKEITGLATVARNITEQKAQQERMRKINQHEQDVLQAREKLALAASQAKSDFLAQISHGIRAPINGVIGMTGLLIETGLTENQEELAGHIKASAESLLGVVNGILNFSNTEAGKIETETIGFKLDEMKSSSHSGSSFTLPQSKVLVPRPQVAPAQAGKPITKYPGARILVAEDNDVNQKIALALLDKLGFKAMAAANGNEVLTALRQFEFDLILMDCQMPDLDGYETTRQIRSSSSGLPAHIPIVAMTANAMKGDREKCLLAGMDDYTAKPVSPQHLAAVIEQWLDARLQKAG